MDKMALVKKLTKEIASELEAIKSAALSTYDVATNEDNKPENKYDTRGLEASYLAGAQAQRVADMKDVLAIFENLPLKKFTEKTPIALTALVELELNGKTQMVLLMPKGGGQSTVFEGKPVQVITTESPLGKALLNQYVGDTVNFEMGATKREYEIVSVA